MRTRSYRGVAICTVSCIMAAAVVVATSPPHAAVPAALARHAGAGTPTASSRSGFVEHRYRVVGKVRLALFWVTRDNVGSARMTFRSEGNTSAIALLVGSDPQVAPRHLNQWGYLREETRSDQADVFTLRSLAGDETAPATPIALGSGPRVGVSCSSMQSLDVTSLVTTVDGGGATYRMFDRLLDQIASTSRWQARRISRPAGAAAGFLTALQDLMRAGSGPSDDRKSMAPVTYVYNNAIYDLGIRDSRPLGQTTIGSRTFNRLTRSDFFVRNRTTNAVSKFGVTYSPDAAVMLPVQIFYQPSFWLSVELRLDDEIDVPPDPAADGTVLERIRTICGTSGHDPRFTVRD